MRRFVLCRWWQEGSPSALLDHLQVILRFARTRQNRMGRRQHGLIRLHITNNHSAYSSRIVRTSICTVQTNRKQMAPCHPVLGTACFACLRSMVCLAAKRRVHGFQHARGTFVRAVCASVPGADSGGKSGVPCKGEKESKKIDFRNEKASWDWCFFNDFKKD